MKIFFLSFNKVPFFALGFPLKQPEISVQASRWSKNAICTLFPGIFHFFYLAPALYLLPHVLMARPLKERTSLRLSLQVKRKETTRQDGHETIFPRDRKIKRQRSIDIGQLSQNKGSRKKSFFLMAVPFSRGGGW